MPTERVLIEIVTAANMAGLKEAQAGFLGFTPQILLAGAALAGIVFVGKAAIENYEAQQKATLDLTQAYATQKDTLAAHKNEIESFLQTNKRFIADQYDTEAALAQAVRAGHAEKDAIRLLNDALDLSVIKHVAVSEAMNGLILAEAGNSRGLRFLGITTVEYNEIMKSKLSVEEKDAQLLALVETRTKDARKATTELQQSQNALNKDWQDFTVKIGPLVTAGLDDIVKSLNNVVKAGNDLGDFLGWIGAAPGKIADFVRRPPLPSQPTYSRPPSGARQHGGPVYAGGTYTVGESGMELLHMGSQGGYVTPGSGGGTQIHVHIDRGAFIDGVSVDRLANAVAQRLAYVTGR